MPQIGRRIYPGMKRAAWGFMQSGDFPVPVLHLKFGKNVGSVAYDSSPEGNDGTIYGVSWIKGWLGPGLDFDYIDDYVSVPDDDSLDLVSTLTMFTRLKPEAIYVGGSWVYENYITLKTGAYGMRFDDVGVLDSFISRDSVSKYLSGSSVVEYEGKWFDVGWTYDSEYRRNYINGVEDVSQEETGDIDVSANPLKVGELGESRRFNGIIDEFVLWDVALTAAQYRQWSLGYR